MIRNRFVAYRPPEAGVPVSSGDAPRSQNNQIIFMTGYYSRAAEPKELAESSAERSTGR
jgi:hypothetical protein